MSHDAVPFTVQVIRSPKRRRTVGAQLRGGVLTVRVPAWMSADDTDRWTEKMVASFRRKVSAERIDLTERAATLARRHGLRTPTSIRWSDDMVMRWGSCSLPSGNIRISTRLAPFPDWVIDSVIVHELCHLQVRHHDEEFWALANRYPKMERAIGFLMAKGDSQDDGLPD